MSNSYLKNHDECSNKALNNFGSVIKNVCIDLMKYNSIRFINSSY